MTAKDWKKAFKQVEHKLAESNRQLKFNKPKHRKYGKGTRSCTLCYRKGGLIRRYGLNVCRQCFREVAESLGFNKY